MGIRIKAVQRKQTVGKYEGTYRYQMVVDTYNSLVDTKVIEEASARSGINKSVMQAAWGVIADVVKAWATEGHRVSVPGLGTMRFGVNATTVEDVEDVSKELITCRKVIFTPNSEIKQELEETSISITCYDKDGNVVKRVTSDDEGNVEDPDDENGTATPDPDSGGSDSGSGSDSGNDDSGGLEG